MRVRVSVVGFEFPRREDGLPVFLVSENCPAQIFRVHRERQRLLAELNGSVPPPTGLMKESATG